MRQSIFNHKVVIVGGGAGGLELACKLGRKFGKACVTLVEKNLYHIWKPSLHEVAAGTLDINQEGLSYSMLAYQNNFTFVFGNFTHLDTSKQEITVAALGNASNEVIFPERKIPFTQLCIAVGSTSHYYQTEGADKHTISLNSATDAERFRLEMVKHMLIADQEKKLMLNPTTEETSSKGKVNVLIIGGGATGVELAAELREASNTFSSYGLEKLNPNEDVNITIIEGSDRILAPLKSKVSKGATELLNKRKIRILTNTRITKIEKNIATDQSGARHPFHICLWAAGIKGHDFLSTLGLATNKIGQLEVTSQLTVKGHHNIYALGDCAACLQEEGAAVPPRAQAANQQASYLYLTLSRDIKNQTPYTPKFIYKDKGSLVSIGTETSIGSLMGALTGGSLLIEGLFARWIYMSLHLLHHRNILGLPRTIILALARTMIRRSTALVKLH